MAHLGDFGAPMGAIEAKPADLDTVGLVSRDGPIKIRLRPADHTAAFPMMEFARLVAVGLPAKDMTSMSVVYGVLEACIFPDDFSTTRNVMMHQGDEGLTDLVLKLYERWAGVPLGGSAPSSDGASETPEEPSKSSARPSKRAKRRAPSETPEQAQARLEKVILGT